MLTIALQTRRLGRIQLLGHIVTAGSPSSPAKLVLDARSVGPRISIGLDRKPGAAAGAIDFGKVAVLATHRRTVALHNPGKVPAEVKLFVSGQASVFAIDPGDAVVQPGETLDATVSVQLDETYTFKESIHVLVTHGDEQEVALHATGVGHTLYCADLTGQRELHFGDRFTGAPFSREIVLENHGRRVATVLWCKPDVQAAVKELGKRLPKPGAADASMLPAERRGFFSIEPTRASIAPKQACTFVMTGFASSPVSTADRFELLAGIGAGVRPLIRSGSATALLRARRC